MPTKPGSGARPRQSPRTPLTAANGGTQAKRTPDSPPASGATEPASEAAGSPAPVEEAPPARAATVEVSGEHHAYALDRRTLTRLAAISVAIVIAGAFGGWLVAMVQPETHAARADIFFERDEEMPTGFLREDRSLATQIVRLRSRGFLEPVAVENDLTYEQLRKKVSAWVVDESEILRLQVKDRSGQRATGLAQAITDAYVAETVRGRELKSEEFLRTELAALDTKLSELEDRALDLERERLAAAGAGPVPELTSEELIVRDQIGAVLDQQTELRAAIDAASTAQLDAPRVEALGQAYELDKPVSPRPVFSTATGALAAIGLAVVVLAVLVRRHRRSV